MREQTSGIDNASVEVEQRSSMSFGSRGVQINLTGSNLDTLREVADEIKTVVAGFDGIDSASTASATAARAPRSSSTRSRPPPSARPPPPSSPPRKT